MYYRGVVSRLRVFSLNLCSIVVWRVWIDSRWTFYVPLVNVWTPDATDRCCSPCCVGLAAGVCVWWQVCGDSSVCAIHHPLDRAECFWDRFERWYWEKPSVLLVYFNSRRALQKVSKDKGLFFSRVGLLSTSDRISLSEMIRWSGSIVRRIQVSEIETATLKRRERDDSPVSSKDHVHCKLCVDRATPINLWSRKRKSYKRIPLSNNFI